MNAENLAEEFLSFPDSIAKNRDVLSAVDALMARHADRHLGSIDDWADQLSEKLSRFTD